MFQFVQVECSGSVAILTLRKPPINALDQAVLDELMSAAEQVESDEVIRVVLIASGIEGIFCVGGDLKYWPKHYAQHPHEVSAAGRRVFARLEQISKPTLAVMDGHVIGDGLSLALSCDIRIASQATLFRLPETGYGFIPGWGTIGRLARTVGQAVAAELLFTGAPLTAKRAQLYGMVNRLTASETLLSDSLILAHQIAEKSSTALREAKAVLRHLGKRVEEEEAWEAICFAATWGSPDWQRGLHNLFRNQEAGT